MPFGGGHDPCDGDDIFVGDLVMKEVAHRVHEDHLWCTPAERLGQLFGNEPKIETLLVGMALYTAESLGKSLGVAMFAARANLRTATDRVPSCISPFNRRLKRHYLNPPVPELFKNFKHDMFSSVLLRCEIEIINYSPFEFLIGNGGGTRANP